MPQAKERENARVGGRREGEMGGCKGVGYPAVFDGGRRLFVLSGSWLPMAR